MGSCAPVSGQKLLWSIVAGDQASWLWQVRQSVGNCAATWLGLEAPL